MTAEVILNAFEHNTNIKCIELRGGWHYQIAFVLSATFWSCSFIQFTPAILFSLLLEWGDMRCDVHYTKACVVLQRAGLPSSASLCDFGIRATLLIALGSAHPFPYWVTNCYQGKRALYPSSGSLMPSFFSHTLAPHDTIFQFTQLAVKGYRDTFLSSSSKH